MPKPEPLKVGDTVETLVMLPGIPVGCVGRIKEIGQLFLAVELEDGRVGYYSSRQLRRREAANDGGAA